jgi:hypothetical protein
MPYADDMTAMLRLYVQDPGPAGWRAITEYGDCRDEAMPDAAVALSVAYPTQVFAIYDEANGEMLGAWLDGVLVEYNEGWEAVE